MIYVVSRFNHEYNWLDEYTSNVVLYDRSEKPAPNAIIVPNIGTDLYDKFTFIIDNYDNLPDVAVYTKCNLFKYMPKEEFDKVKDNKTFTPLLTKNHKVYSDAQGPVCYYDSQGMFNEINNFWYLNPHPVKDTKSFTELTDILQMRNRYYNAFAPGSNYILPKENILKHPKSFYEKLRSFLEWDRYPGEAQIIERNLYYIWS